MQGQVLKTSKQLVLFLATYLNWWCNVIFLFVNKKYSPWTQYLYIKTYQCILPTCCFSLVIMLWFWI